MVKNNVNAKEIWLKYFNDVLLSKGLITENEHRKMRVLIRDRRKFCVKVNKKHPFRQVLDI